jgi:hypothetical protein
MQQEMQRQQLTHIETLLMLGPLGQTMATATSQHRLHPAQRRKRR